jgi:ubiquinone/menaquinone biosynthesis C-methylase UbiE
MDARLQRRVQRYGWDLAALEYEPLWESQLAPAQSRVMRLASLKPGERVLDVACGTGLISFAAARIVGPGGHVVGVDISGEMVECARRRAQQHVVPQATFERMDAEKLELADASFDAVLCGLGLMYMPDPAQALREMRRVLRPGGRIAVAVWGERKRCGWSHVLQIVDAEVESDVCPLFFQLGEVGALARLCLQAKLEDVETHRIAVTLDYADGREACRAVFAAGPAALAWSRFDAAARERVNARYLEALTPWRYGDRYRVPGEFVVASARVQAPEPDSESPESSKPSPQVVHSNR